MGDHFVLELLQSLSDLIDHNVSLLDSEPVSLDTISPHAVSQSNDVLAAPRSLTTVASELVQDATSSVYEAVVEMATTNRNLPCHAHQEAWFQDNGTRLQPLTCTASADASYQDCSVRLEKLHNENEHLRETLLSSEETVEKLQKEMSELRTEARREADRAQTIAIQLDGMNAERTNYEAQVSVRAHHT